MERCVGDKMISQYLDGELLPRAGQRVREHLAVCPRCAHALEAMRRLDESLRQGRAAPVRAPDLASRVTAELHRRGAFFKARVATVRRRVFGESLLSVRMAAALSVAASIMMFAAVGMDHLTRDSWARKTGPVLADAERVLVRLVYVKGPEELRQLAWAREEAKRLDLSQRLAEARSGAESAWAGDLGPIETTFALLAQNDPLPPQVVAQLSDGELLQRTVRLREHLSPGG